LKSSHSGLAAILLLLILASIGLYSPVASAGTTVRTCDWCGNWSDIQSSANWWVANDPSIAPNQYFVTASAAPYYSIQGCFRKQLQGRVGYRAIAQTTMGPCPSPDYPESPPNINDPRFLESRYYVRFGDINGDGKIDLFVTGQADRYVQDFFLIQENPSSFSVVSEPAWWDVDTANSWPVIGAPVYREDLNFDGLYDFYIEEISEVVQNAPNLIVYTRRNVGTQAVRAVSDGQGFSDVYDEVMWSVNSGAAGLDFFYSQTCVDYIDESLVLPYVSFDWLYDQSPDSWFHDQYLAYYGGINYSNGFAQGVQTCYPTAVNFSKYSRNVFRAWGDYAGLNGFNCITCSERAREILDADFNWKTIFGGTVTAGVIASRAWILTGGLIADDATGVGIADDWLIPISFTVGIAASTVYVWNENFNTPDRGPVAAPPAHGVSTPGDPFQMPGGFDPNDPEGQDRPGNSKGNSTRLGDNLERAGWPKPHEDAHAHHIVQGGSEDTFAIESRALLRDYGIDIDEAANGVWLPRSDSVTQTAARGHLSKGMHTTEYRRVVLERLRSAASSAAPGEAPAALRAELQNIGRLLLENSQFW
jgi:hypothetical protein